MKRAVKRHGRKTVTNKTFSHLAPPCRLALEITLQLKTARQTLLATADSHISRHSASVLAMASMAVAIDGLSVSERTCWRLNEIVAQIHESTNKVNEVSGRDSLRAADLIAKPQELIDSQLVAPLVPSNETKPNS